MKLTPQTIRRMHLTLLLLWLFVGTPVAVLERRSIVFLVAISVYAIVAAHFAGWSAERPTEIIDPKDAA